MGKNAYSKKDKTEFYPTAEWVKQKLYSMIQGNPRSILDPCCGDGGLEIQGKYQYKLMDIENRGLDNVEICDFLKREPHEGEQYDCAVVNPPFGLTIEFINQAFKFCNDVYIIAPFKKVINKYAAQIERLYLDWRIPWAFGVSCSIGLLHLKKTRNEISSEVSAVINGKFPKSRTWANAFYTTDKAPNKYFIVNRLTAPRVVRNEQLIKDIDVYSPNDETAFIAMCANINTKKGDKIKRQIIAFDSEEECRAFRQKYIDNEEFVRNYCYIYGGTVLKLHQIPLLNYI